MAITILRLGSPRIPKETVRLGTVRRPPRGVKKSRYAADNWFDVWLPDIAPEAATIEFALKDPSPKRWREFERRFLRELKDPAKSRLLDLLAALSHATHFTLGCYCEDESRYHRSILRKLLIARGAAIRPRPS